MQSPARVIAADAQTKTLSVSLWQSPSGRVIGTAHLVGAHRRQILALEINIGFEQRAQMLVGCKGRCSKQLPNRVYRAIDIGFHHLGHFHRANSADAACFGGLFA